MQNTAFVNIHFLFHFFGFVGVLLRLFLVAAFLETSVLSDRVTLFLVEKVKKSQGTKEVCF